MTTDSREPWYATRDISTTFVKGLKVLAAFDDGSAYLTLPEIGTKTGYDRATVRRLVITLVDEGLLTKTDKSFALTPKILTLASQYLRGHGIGATVQPILNEYSGQLGKEISLATVSEAEAIYLARSNITGSTVSFGFTVGSRLPLLHTAIGRMLLATLNETSRQALVNEITPVQYTPHTVTNPVDIEQQVQAARDQGFALVTSEFEAGVSGLAVPIGRLGETKTVIGVSGPVTAFDAPPEFDHCLATLQMCAVALDRAWIEGP